MTYEFGHALGFADSNGWLSNVDDRDTPAFFTSTNAVREYNSVSGTAANPDGVPIDQDGGTGTAYSHWDDAIFGNELMTGFINVGLNHLIIIAVGAFEDMGYTDDYAAADAYSPPTAVVPAGVNPPANASASRVLPARISFPDRAPMILRDDDATRQLVRTALDDALSTAPPHGPLDLRHLADEQRAVLAAWGSVGREVASPLGTAALPGLTSHLTANWPQFGQPGYGKIAPRLFAVVSVG